ncbi:hypothetical protein Lepto7375DRAFT_6800 [Leptolyngbya sp. PCC 7375]|nr:hypothetical protein Lepto7375DRAFT_6800 [Leptolyngbya sp. PCC 7375]
MNKKRLSKAVFIASELISEQMLNEFISVVLKVKSKSKTEIEAWIQRSYLSKLIFIQIVLGWVFYHSVVTPFIKRYIFDFCLPEECIAEIGVLKQRMNRANAAPWHIRQRIVQEYLLLIWAVHIQAKLENLFLPSSNHQIDD